MYFDLPVLQTAPEADSITDSTVTISWSAWDEENEDGTLLSSAPEDDQINVIAEVAGEDQESVKISWELPADGSSCTSGVTLLTIFYASINLEPSHNGAYEVTDPSSTSFTLTGLKVEGNYSIQLTLKRAEEKCCRSKEIYYFVPKLPEYQAAPTVSYVSSNSLTINWPAWDGVIGTPPVSEYRLLSKLSESGDWPSTFSRVNASNDQDEYAVIMTPLEPDTEYDFMVVAVREGPNGDGPPGPILKRVKTNSPGSVGLIVGVTIGTVSLAIIALLAVYGIWKYQRSTSKPKTVERQTNDSKEVTSEAAFDYENVSKDSGHTNLVRYVPSKKHKECTLSATGNDNAIDGNEIPSIHISEGAQAKQQINKDVQVSKEKPTTYQNSSDDEFSLRHPMAISRFPLFMRSSTAKEMISATFKRLEAVSSSTNASSFSGTSPENLHKNRFGDIVPLDNHRPLLKSECLTQGGNDYINASVVNISGLKQTLIMTQAPLPTTVEDFWRLVFDYQCQTIIMLNESDCENHESIKVKRFILNNWPKSGDSLIPLINFIAATGFGDRGATLIHCIDGASRSGIYVTVCSEINRIKKRQTIHVFDTVKNMKVSNPNAIRTKEDYMMCHQLLNCYLTEMQDYDVIV
ncbi:hypothetical protein BSL78_26105 [Apostichopus japonicus]|uniref:Uncharacterized protein n=1 Tax=Stichopus japonicus TaxID=307972 RepID=A0A2G8JMX1_STIJA|nr:hypothetical protein BSL78_26105 [Apostichopus japonicus]